jgi:hypothetical protein
LVPYDSVNIASTPVLRPETKKEHPKRLNGGVVSPELSSVVGLTDLGNLGGISVKTTRQKEVFSTDP